MEEHEDYDGCQELGLGLGLGNLGIREQGKGKREKGNEVTVKVGNK
jgi:hypothetical protein